MEKYYRYLDIPDLKIIQEKVLALVDPDLLTQRSITFFNRQKSPVYAELKKIAELNNFLESKGWLEYHVDYVVSCIPPHEDIVAHSDPMGDDDNTNSVRILVPLSGCEGTVTSFYTSSANPILKHSHNSKGDILPYYGYNAKDLTVATQYILDRPALMHTIPIHGVQNLADNFRVNLWIDFNEQIDLLKEL